MVDWLTISIAANLLVAIVAYHIGWTRGLATGEAIYTSRLDKIVAMIRSA